MTYTILNTEVSEIISWMSESKKIENVGSSIDIDWESLQSNALSFYENFTQRDLS